MPNTLAFPLGFLGIAWAGAATAPLNPDYKEEEFAFYLEVWLCLSMCVYLWVGRVGRGRMCRPTCAYLSVSGCNWL